MHRYYSGIKIPRTVLFDAPRALCNGTAGLSLILALTRLLVLISKREWFVPFSAVVYGLPRHCANVESIESRVYPVLSTCRSQEIRRRAQTQPSLLSRNLGDRSPAEIRESYRRGVFFTEKYRCRLRTE